MIQMLILGILILTAACHKEHLEEERHAPTHVVAVKEVGKDFDVPAKLLKLAETGMINSLGTLGYFPISVVLTQKNEGVLNFPEIRYDFPKGGGELDFAQVLGSSLGSFYFKFDVSTEKEDVLKVYFVSQTRKRRLESEIWGMGCNKFVDITSYFHSEIATRGLKINSTEFRHLSLLGGHFVFVLNSGKRIFLSKLTVKDSRFPEADCVKAPVKENEKSEDEQ